MVGCVGWWWGGGEGQANRPGLRSPYVVCSKPFTATPRVPARAPVSWVQQNQTTAARAKARTQHALCHPG